MERGQSEPQLIIDESSDEEEIVHNLLTPRRISRTVSDRGTEMGLKEEFELKTIQNVGVKDNTAPIIKFETEGLLI